MSKTLNENSFKSYDRVLQPSPPKFFSPSSVTIQFYYSLEIKKDNLLS